MSRTYRKHAKWHEYDEEFVARLERGLVPHEIGDPDPRYGEAWSAKNKRKAKKIKRRERRLRAQQYIDEHLDELNL